MFPECGPGNAIPDFERREANRVSSCHRRYCRCSAPGNGLAHCMNRFIAFTILLALAGLTCAKDNLDGAYERVSLTNTRTGESPESADRRGLLILAHGYYSMMTMKTGRHVIDSDTLETMPDDQHIAYLQEWLDFNGHTGRYEVDGDTLTWYRDISENPTEVDTVSKLRFERRNDLLVIWFTLPNGDRYDWVWRKLP